LLIVRRSHLFGWAPLPRGQETDHVLVRAGTGVILTGPGGKPVTAMGRIIYDTFDPVDVDDVRDFVTGNEGNRSWMYGDGRGFVTIGFGHLVENLGEAQGLNLANKDTGGAATADEVEHDFGAAQTGTSNIADDYEAGAILRLAPGVDDTLFYEDFPTHFDVANDFFPMEDLPTEVQIALFDLAFQIGGKGVRFDEGEERPGGLSRGETYLKLQSALLRHDWAEAGEQMDTEAAPSRGPKRADQVRPAAKRERFFTTNPPQNAALFDALLKS
jgi:hypothetical protein